MVELKYEKRRPVLFTYAMTSSPEDIHTLIVKKEKTVRDLVAAGKEDRTGSAGQQLEQVAPVATDEQKINRYASLVRSVCQKAKTVSKIAIVSLPVSAVFHTVVNLPVIKKEEFDSFLKAEVKKLLPYRLEEVALDYEILPRAPESKMQTVLVNAVPKQLVLFYSKVFERAGLKLTALETEATALSRSLIGRDTALSMIIDMGAERTNFFIVDKTVPITHHSIELGGQKINTLLKRAWGCADDEVDQMKYDLFAAMLSDGETLIPRQAFVDLCMPVFDPIVKEIGYSFDLYLRQSGNTGKRPEKIILTGGAAFLPYLSDYCAEMFKMKCYVGDPWGRVVYQQALKETLHEIGPRMAVAIGLALRSVI